MEHDPSRRQYAPTSYPPPPPPPPQQQQQRQQSQAAGTPAQYAQTGAVGRFRQSAYIPQSPSHAGQAPVRAGADTTSYYGFQQGAQYPSVGSLQQSPVQYTPDVQSTDASRQPQQYPQYQGSVMYGMPQPQAPQTPQSTYEPQYRQRPNTASETLASQFGVPQTAQYYLAGHSGPTSAVASEFPAQPLPSQYQPHEYAQAGPSASQVYASAMMDPSASSTYPTFGQQTQYVQQQQQQQAPSNDQAFDDYQRSIRHIATLAHEGSLRDVDQYLLHISQYLLGHAESLELTKDDQSQHGYRIRLWDEFNRTWLAALQRQYDLTEEMNQTGQSLGEPRSIMSAQTLERLAQELIKLCDSVERHGLVDYQMGVAEEEIIDLLLKCLDLLEPHGERASDVASAAGALRNR